MHKLRLQYNSNSSSPWMFQGIFLTILSILLWTACTDSNQSSQTQHDGMEIEVDDASLKEKVEASYIIGHSLAFGLQVNMSKKYKPLRGSTEESMSLKSCHKYFDAEQLTNDESISNIILYLGNNDFYANMSEKSNIMRITDGIIALADSFPGKNVYIIGLTKINGDTSTYRKQHVVAEGVNARLKAEATNHGFTYIDNPIESHERELSIQRNGIHPNAYGYRKLFKILFSQVE